MRTVVETAIARVTIDGGVVECDAPSVRRLAESFVDTGPTGYVSDLDYWAALEVAEALGGRVVEYDGAVPALSGIRW